MTVYPPISTGFAYRLAAVAVFSTWVAASVDRVRGLVRSVGAAARCVAMAAGVSADPAEEVFR